MKNYFLAFALAVLVVLTGFSLKQSVARVGGTSPAVTAIGGAPMPAPPPGAAIGGAPMPAPPPDTATTPTR